MPVPKFAGYHERGKRTDGTNPSKAAMLRPAVLFWLAVTACAARAGEATDLSAVATQGPRVRPAPCW